MPPSASAEPDWPRCDHPWPCGDEWPDGLTGPFDFYATDHIRLRARDGVELRPSDRVGITDPEEVVLDGILLRPVVPDGVKVPVVLITGPYFGQHSPPVHDPDLWDLYPYPARMLAENGTAVALFNVRGTGDSGGCFEWWGPNEQRDHDVLLDWLARQEWTNGRIGMWGVSYLAGTAFEGAIQNHPALKTVVVSGLITDPYTFFHSPQGAAVAGVSAFAPLVTVFGAYGPGDPTKALDPSRIGKYVEPARLAEFAKPERLGALPEKVCPELARFLATVETGLVTDLRDADVWTSRRLIDRFPDVTAAVLMAHGFEDQEQSGSAHTTQESAAWAALTNAPKWQIEGPWAHQFPDTNRFHPELARGDWNRTMMAWFDFWLKGQGAPPVGLGTVEYQDQTGKVRTSAAWPPPEAREEVLYLGGGTMRATPGGEAGTFRSTLDPVLLVPPPATSYAGAALCAATPPGTPFSVAYWSQPLAEDALLAGNPFAYLRLESTDRGGIVTIGVLDVGPDFRCDGLEAHDVRVLGRGFADLRFHAGNYAGRDFPVGTATNVRIEIANLAQGIPAGHTIVTVLSYGDLWAVGGPFFPELTVRTDGGPHASHMVLPFVEGTLGGSAPTVPYPARPFGPGWDPPEEPPAGARDGP